MHARCKKHGCDHGGHEGEHACRRCGHTLWGRHGHRLRSDHGEPHYATCAGGCGLVIGTQQLPSGRDADPTSHGLHCPACAERRAAEFRSE